MFACCCVAGGDEKELQIRPLGNKWFQGSYGRVLKIWDFVILSRLGFLEKLFLLQNVCDMSKFRVSVAFLCGLED